MAKAHGSRGLMPTLLAGLVLAAFGLAPVHAQSAVDPWDGNWHGSITPYGWLPGVHAESTFQVPSNAVIGGGSSVTSKSDSNVFDKMDGALMIEGDLRKGRWGLFGDFDWVKFSSRKGRITRIGGQWVGADINLQDRWNAKGGMVNLAGLYNLGHGRWGFADVLLGARYLWLKGNLSWDLTVQGNGDRLDLANSGHLDNQMHATDAIVGLRGRWTPFADPRWYFPYYADIGTGDSNTTYQLMVGAGYSFSWGDMALSYRDVKYSADDHDKALESLELEGPTISFSWQF